MRWMWIDRFLEFQSGRRAVARKNISLVEEQIDEYSPAYPYMPASLIIEGIAQTAGLLVGERSGFKDRVILAKVAKAALHRLARPGDTLIYTAEVADIKRDGAFCNCTSHIDGELQAEVELVFAMLDDRFPDPIFDPADFLSMVRIFGLYDVGVDANGQPLQVPPHLLAAEQARP
jgi:3-hydroxyacyl-[acyl-carrier-protein] dehydratase